MPLGEMLHRQPEAEDSDKVLIDVTTCVCGTQHLSSCIGNLYDRLG